MKKKRRYERKKKKKTLQKELPQKPYKKPLQMKLLIELPQKPHKKPLQMKLQKKRRMIEEVIFSQSKKVAESKLARTDEQGIV